MRLTDTQHRILAALCRSVDNESGFAPPATNQEIADEVYLSVDAVKAHLRTLYRKFEIEDLPHNQKRARLAELVIQGGYLEAEAGEGAPAEPPARRTPTSSAERHARRPWLFGVAMAGIVVVLAVVALALTGAFSGSSADSTGVTAYKEAVRGYCRLALGTEEGRADRTAQTRARTYLAVIETVRGRVESLPPPSGSNRALERFREGLTSAADYTSVVAEGPPEGGSSAQANVVAELTFAAGQVQAGALGYDLGPDCVAIGDLVNSSARNAARAP
jgi:DNA-binding CsgD family transcriptional regulator